MCLLLAFLLHRELLQKQVSRLSVEKDSLFDKAQNYVSAARESRQSLMVDTLKSAMDTVYSTLQSHIQMKELYDGGTVLDVTRKTLKQVSSQYLQAASNDK